MATELERSDQNKWVELLKEQLLPSLTEGKMEFTVVDALKEHMILLACPYSFTTVLGMMERYM